MNPTHAGVALGPMGVVAAPGPSGPIGIGIGCVPMPIMSASQIGTFQPHAQHHKNLVSTDSLDDKDKFAQLFLPRSSPNNVSLQTSTGSQNNPMTWTNPLLQSTAGLRYPIMGMSVMGPTHDVLYGLIGTAAANVQRNISNATVNIPSQNSVLLLSSMNPSSSISEPVAMSGTGDTKCLAGTQDSKVVNHDSTTAIQCKDIIHCKSCTLFPPNPSTPPPTTREKPPGCRTVFVGGLPENATEEIIREMFEKCGDVATIRMSKKNFCHIRFEMEHCIEAAIYLSGFRIRIGSNSDPPNIGRLHVDYAQARDDLFEFECRQRQLLREHRHKERIEKERLMPPSPPNIAVYSDHEASTVAEKIKSDDAFVKGIHTLVTWLEKGDCIKRNSTSFYSMIQSTNSHVRRLLNEKSQYEDELGKAKELMRQRLTGLLLQFCQIEKVFISACQKKSWDHFSKPQRKNIEMWRKQATEVKNSLLEDALAERNDEEMELDSDSESEMEKEKQSEPRAIPAKKARWDVKTVHHLKEENDSLRCQLEASNNEVDMIKADLKSELEAKDEDLKSLQQKLNEARHMEWPTSSHVGHNEEFQRDSAGHCDSSSSENSSRIIIAENNQAVDVGATLTQSITETDARLIGVISTFLHVHPFGASLDYIWSYTQQVLPTIRANQIEALMTKFPGVFRQEISGVGAMMERKWVFVGFHSL